MIIFAPFLLLNYSSQVRDYRFNLPFKKRSDYFTINCSLIFGRPSKNNNRLLRRHFPERGGGGDVDPPTAKKILKTNIKNILVLRHPLIQIYFVVILPWLWQRGQESSACCHHQGPPTKSSNQGTFCFYFQIIFQSAGKKDYPTTALPPYLLTYLPTYLPTYLATFLYSYLPNYLPIYLSTYLLTYLHTYLPTYLPNSLPSYPPTYLPIYLSTDQLTYLPIYLPSFSQPILKIFNRKFKSH